MSEVINAIVFIVLSFISLILFTLAWHLWRDSDWIREIRYQRRMREEYWNNVFSKPKPPQGKNNE